MSKLSLNGDVIPYVTFLTLTLFFNGFDDEQNPDEVVVAPPTLCMYRCGFGHVCLYGCVCVFVCVCLCVSVCLSVYVSVCLPVFCFYVCVHV